MKRLATVFTDLPDAPFPLAAGYFPEAVPSPLPDADREAMAGWEWSLRPEVLCLEQWLDFNA